MTDNLALWQQVEKTPVAHVKEITGKSYKGNSPKPHYLIHKATETFGPCGIGWGFTIVDERIEDGAGGEKLHVARVKVWYEWQGKRGEVEHIGGTQFSGLRSSGKPFTDEDAPKKSVTDALVKALSMIGFAGDIFMGRYDDSKYVSELRQEAAEEKRSVEQRTTDRRSEVGRQEVDRQDREASDSLWQELNHVSNMRGLQSFWADNQDTIKRMDEFNCKRFTDKKDALKRQFEKPADNTVADIEDTFPGSRVVNETLHPLMAGE